MQPDANLKDFFLALETILTNLDAELHVHKDPVLEHWTAMVLTGTSADEGTCVSGEGESIADAFKQLLLDLKRNAGAEF